MAIRMEGYNKYRNVRTQVDGISFHSKREAERYKELKLLLQSGKISNLRLQVPYDLHVEGMKITRYVADFVYEECGTTITEDSKGAKTEAYKIKKKLMQAICGIVIRET